MPDQQDTPLNIGPWRRDTHATLVCACRHTSTEHRHDMKNSSPCERGSCGCRWMRPQYRYVREWRTIELPLDDATLARWTGPTAPAAQAAAPSHKATQT